MIYNFNRTIVELKQIRLKAEFWFLQILIEP